MTVKAFASSVSLVSTNSRTPNTSHLPGHLRAEYPVAGVLSVQVRNVERPRRRFLVGVTDGVSFSTLGKPGGFVRADEARAFAQRWVNRLA